MKIDMKKTTTFAFVLALISASPVWSVPEVTNKTGYSIDCHISAYTGGVESEFERCEDPLTIADGASHMFNTGGNAGFNLPHCAAAPKGKGVLGGYTAWTLDCSVEVKGEAVAKLVSLGVANELREGDLDVATPKTVTLDENNEMVIK